MAAETLIDFDALDLTQVIVDKAELLGTLHQRGRFEMVDGILHLDLTGGTVVGFKEIRGDDWWASDHIPGRPLFPGALMIEAAAQICTYHFLHVRTDLHGAFVGFGGVDKVRFRSVVEPDCRMVFVGRVERVRSRMFTYSAQGFVGRRLCFEAEILGVVV
jgi:3-hydroxyacyl-[acyl-carrier-protein] dehydratase